ncbi:MAG: hypothetical protein D3906_00880 [Candidatus Electrothrix sp. AUS1_2]|nr:hypothetical protein [Candidatus Electrothrix sp. AUS1_2]
MNGQSLLISRASLRNRKQILTGKQNSSVSNQQLLVGDQKVPVKCCEPFLRSKQPSVRYQ